MLLKLYNKTKFLEPFSYFATAIIGSDAFVLAPDHWSFTALMVCMIPLYGGFYDKYFGVIPLFITTTISFLSSVIILTVRHEYNCFNPKVAMAVFFLCAFVGLLKLITAPKGEVL